MDDETSNFDQRKSSFCYSLEEEPGKKEPKKGISVTRALVMLGFDDWKDLEPENMRKLNGYVEEKLKKALDKQLEELEEKSKIAEQARAYFGEDMYKKLMEIEGSRNEALMFDQDSSDDDEKPGDANETADSTSKVTSLGDAVSASMNTSKFKSKVQKASSKSKTSKSNTRRNSKQPRPKSFIDQNIKSAKTTAQVVHRRQSDLPGDNTEQDSEQVTKTMKASTLTKRSSISEAKIRSNNSAARKGISKEQKALHSAYLCLIEEHKRRKDVRKNITVKFGRANAKLKLIMSQQKSGDPAKKDGLASLLAKKKTNNEQKDSEESENKRKGKSFAKVQNYDDPDRI